MQQVIQCALAATDTPGLRATPVRQDTRATPTVP